MLVQSMAAPARAAFWAVGPPGFRSRSERALVSRRYRSSVISEIHVLGRSEVVDLRKLFVERLPRRQQLEQRRPGHRLDDQTVPLLAENGLIAGELEIPRDANRLVASVPKQTHDSFGLHGYSPDRRERGLCLDIC